MNESNTLLHEAKEVTAVEENKETVQTAEAKEVTAVEEKKETVQTAEAKDPVRVKVDYPLLNLRKKPTLDAKVKYVMKKGDVITVTLDDGEWLEVIVDVEDAVSKTIQQIVGYCMKRYTKPLEQ